MSLPDLTHSMTHTPDPGELERTREEMSEAAATLAHVSQVAATVALAASVAHDISQPLSGLVANSNTCLRMLEASPPDIASARETTRRTLRDVNRAVELVTRLRATFGELELARRPFDMNEAVREMMLLTAGVLSRGGITVGSSLAGDLPQIIGDRDQIKLVIVNLLQNARDAMLGVHDRARELLIRTQREASNWVRVTIRDTGEELLARMEGLFRAAYSVDSGAVGIGLFVSRSIIERHGGRLWVEWNEVTPGSTVSFSIPSAESA